MKQEWIDLFKEQLESFVKNLSDKQESDSKKFIRLLLNMEFDENWFPSDSDSSDVKFEAANVSSKDVLLTLYATVRSLLHKIVVESDAKDKQEYEDFLVKKFADLFSN